MERAILALFDLAAALALLWAMQNITSEAGFGDLNARWALLRRVTYIAMVAALFVKGIYRLDTIGEPVDALDFGSQLPILIGILLFPMLRAFGVITQDAVVNGNINGERDKRNTNDQEKRDHGAPAPGGSGANL